MSSIKLRERTVASAAVVVRAALTELTRAVDFLQRESLDSLDDHEMLAVFRDLETQRRRLPTVDHRLITELECRCTGRKLLSRGTPGLLTELLHVDVAEAKARVRAAGVLGPRTALTGEPLDPVHPATAAAQAAGTISEKHARVVTGTIGRLPHSLDEDTVGSAEQSLVNQAQGLRPSELIKVAERLTAYLDPDGQLSDDTDRAARRALNIGRQRADGMSPITGLLDPATRAFDRGCTRPGCDIPAQWTQVHHLDEYQYGGRTDIHRMCLVCTFDHRLITEHGFTVRMGANGRVQWIAPKHLDPTQTPRINTFHHPPDLSDPDPP